MVVREDQLGERRLVAYVVTSSDPAPTASELHRFVAQTLPKYMVPAVFVMLGALPLNPNDKVDRWALPASNTLRPVLAQTFVPPRNPAEERLVHVFADVLEVEQVGVYDDFFELGEHSLLVTKLIAWLLNAFQVELAIAHYPVSSNILFELLQSLGCTVQSIPAHHWRSKLLHIAETAPDHPLDPLVSLLATPSELSSESSGALSTEAVFQFDCQNTLNGLAASMITCLPLDQLLLHTYFDYLSQNDWLKQAEPQT